MTIPLLVRPKHVNGREVSTRVPPVRARRTLIETPFIATNVQAEPQTVPQAYDGGPVAAWWHTAAVIAVIAANAIRGSLHAAELRTAVHPDRLSIYRRTILFEWLVLGLVLAGVWLHGSSAYTVLGERWRSMRRFFEDIGIALLLLIATIAVTSILGSHSGGDDGSTQFLLPHGATEMALWIVLSITAGICEEAVYRGYLQKQFIVLTRNVPAGIVLSALAFGSAHLYQGWLKAIPIAVMGGMAGALAHWRRSVRPGMIAHAFQDVLGGIIRH